MRSLVNNSTVLGPFPQTQVTLQIFHLSDECQSSRMMSAMTMVIMTPGCRGRRCSLFCHQKTFYQLKSLFKSFSPMNYYNCMSSRMRRRAMTMVIVTPGCRGGRCSLFRNQQSDILPTQVPLQIFQPHELLQLDFQQDEESNDNGDRDHWLLHSADFLPALKS